MFDKKCEKWSTNKVNASIGAYQRGFFPLYCFISACSALGWKLWGGADHNAVYLAACIPLLCVWECGLLFNIGFSVFGAFSFLLTQLVVYIWNVESFEFSAFSTYICLVRLIWFVSIKRVARFERSLNSSFNYTFWVFSICKTILYNTRGFPIRQHFGDIRQHFGCCCCKISWCIPYTYTQIRKPTNNNTTWYWRPILHSLPSIKCLRNTIFILDICNAMVTHFIRCADHEILVVCVPMKHLQW